MNSFRTGLRDRRHNPVNVQVALRRFCRSDMNRFISFQHMQGPGVRIRINGHGANAHFAAGTHDAQGNFASIRDENFLKHKFSSNLIQARECFPRAETQRRRENQKQNVWRLCAWLVLDWPCSVAGNMWF